MDRISGNPFQSERTHAQTLLTSTLFPNWTAIYTLSGDTEMPLAPFIGMLITSYVLFVPSYFSLFPLPTCAVPCQNIAQPQNGITYIMDGFFEHDN